MVNTQIQSNNIIHQRETRKFNCVLCGHITVFFTRGIYLAIRIFVGVKCNVINKNFIPFKIMFLFSKIPIHRQLGQFHSKNFIFCKMKKLI